MLILLVFGVMAAGAVLLSVRPWGPAPSEQGDSAGSRQVTAKVVRAARCGGGAGDLVEVRLDGGARQARLDGCGHRVGERLQVEVPSVTSRSSELRVTAVAGDDGRSADERRLLVVLATLAGLAGGGYLVLLRGLPRPG